MLPLLAFVVGFGFAGLLDRSATPSQQRQDDQAWQMEIPQLPEVSSSTAQMRQKTWLRAEADSVKRRKARVKKPAKAAWHIVGVVQEPTGSYALVFARGKVAQVPLGGQLPDGSTVTGIEADGVEVKSGDQVKRIGLYQ